MATAEQQPLHETLVKGLSKILSPPDADSKDSPVLVGDDDTNSASTEVVDPSMANSDSEKTLDSTTPVTSEETTVVMASSNPLDGLKLALPEPVQQATTLAVAAVQQWWAQVEPLLRQLLMQLQERTAPLLKAGADSFQQHVQPHLQPHLDVAQGVIDQWRAKLAPHTDKVMAAVQQATEAVRVQAYEPALAYIATASVHVQAHAKTLSALINDKATAGYKASAEWLEAQRPVLLQAWEAAKVHAAALLQQLLAWKAEIEPLARAQLEALRVKSIELGGRALTHSQALAAQAKLQLETHGPPAAAAVKEWAAVQGAIVAKHAEPAVKALEPTTLAVKAWAEETGKKLEPVVKPVQAFAEDTSKKLAPVLADWAKILQAQLALLGQKLEGPTEAFKQWLVTTAQGMCLPLAKPITYEGISEGAFPPAEPRRDVPVPSVD